MNSNANGTVPIESEVDMARRRLLSVKGDPLVFADWEKVVFLHFALPPDLLRRQLSGPFDLELHEGRGIVTLVVLTMRKFRPARVGLGCAMLPLREQRFLNLRTYVRWKDELGALFLWGWLSQPFGLPLPGGFGLPFSFVSSNYQHEPQAGVLRGDVTCRSGGRFAYHASVSQTTEAKACEPDSLSAFALERYTGYFNSRNASSVFRAWHPVWQQLPIEATLEDTSLVTNKFPWFREAKLVAANFAPGFKRVWLGGAHGLEVAHEETQRHHRLSAFYEMP